MFFCCCFSWGVGGYFCLLSSRSRSHVRAHDNCEMPGLLCSRPWSYSHRMLQNFTECLIAGPIFSAQLIYSCSQTRRAIILLLTTRHTAKKAGIHHYIGYWPLPHPAKWLIPSPVMERCKHMKGSEEHCLLGQNTACKFSG